jgi:hypothetical protein
MQRVQSFQLQLIVGGNKGSSVASCVPNSTGTALNELFSSSGSAN